MMNGPNLILIILGLGAEEVVKSAVVEWVQRHPPLVGEHRLPRRLNQHRVIAKRLPHIERPSAHLQAHIVDEHR